MAQSNSGWQCFCPATNPRSGIDPWIPATNSSLQEQANGERLLLQYYVQQVQRKNNTEEKRIIRKCRKQLRRENFSRLERLARFKYGHTESIYEYLENEKWEMVQERTCECCHDEDFSAKMLEKEKQKENMTETAVREAFGTFNDEEAECCVKTLLYKQNKEMKRLRRKMRNNKRKLEFESTWNETSGNLYCGRNWDGKTQGLVPGIDMQNCVVQRVEKTNLKSCKNQLPPNVLKLLGSKTNDQSKVLIVQSSAPGNIRSCIPPGHPHPSAIIVKRQRNMDAHANEDRNMNNDVSSNVNSDMNIQNEGSCRPTVCNDSNCLNKNRLNASTNDIGTITNESFIKNNCKKTYDIKNCNNNKVSYKNNVTNTNSTQTFCCNKTYSTCGTNTEEPIPVQLQTSRERPKPNSRSSLAPKKPGGKCFCRTRSSHRVNHQNRICSQNYSRQPNRSNPSPRSPSPVHYESSGHSSRNTFNYSSRPSSRNWTREDDDNKNSYRRGSSEDVYDNDYDDDDDPYDEFARSSHDSDDDIEIQVEHEEPAYRNRRHSRRSRFRSRTRSRRSPTEQEHYYDSVDEERYYENYDEDRVSTYQSGAYYDSETHEYENLDNRRESEAPENSMGRPTTQGSERMSEVSEDHQDVKEDGDEMNEEKESEKDSKKDTKSLNPFDFDDEEIENYEKDPGTTPLDYWEESSRNRPELLRKGEAAHQAMTNADSKSFDSRNI